MNLPFSFYLALVFVFCAWFNNKYQPEENVAFWVDIAMATSLLIPILMTS